MKPVDMTKFAKKCDGRVHSTDPTFAGKTWDCFSVVERGDCVSAVVASLLELELKEVPFFVEAGNGWWFSLCHWLGRRGLRLKTVERSALPLGPVYASGKSPRGFSHAVVWDGGPAGRVVHDPHPSRAGLVGDPTLFAVIERSPLVCSTCGAAPE